MKLFGVNLSFGFYLPIAGLFKIYRLQGDQKTRIRHTWEFVEFPLWKRFLVTIGSILSLTLASIIIFISLTYLEQEYYISKEEVIKNGIYPSPIAEITGFKKGDKIVKVNGRDYEKFEDLMRPEIFTHEGSYYTVERNGEEIELNIQNDALEEMSTLGQPYISLLVPFEIREIHLNTSASKADLQRGDVIIEVNNESITAIGEYKEALARDEDGEVDLKVLRKNGNASDTIRTTASIDDTGGIGIYINEKIQYSIKTNSFAEAVALGTMKPFKIINIQIKSFMRMFSGDIVLTKSTSGPIKTPLEIFGNPWKRFWNLTGMLSVVTAFLNLLPFPRTVFWEIVPLGYEAITNEKISYSLFEKTKKIGFVIVLVLMVWIIGNDIFRLLY